MYSKHSALGSRILGIIRNNNIMLSSHSRVFCNNNQKWWSPTAKKTNKQTKFSTCRAIVQLASVKCHAKKTFSVKNNRENFAIVVHAPQTRQYLVISRCRFAGNTMTQNACAGLLFNSLNPRSGNILPCCRRGPLFSKRFFDMRTE